MKREERKKEKPKVGGRKRKWRREIVSPCENQFMAVKMSVQARVVLHGSNWTGHIFHSKRSHGMYQRERKNDPDEREMDSLR